MAKGTFTHLVSDKLINTIFSLCELCGVKYTLDSGRWVTGGWIVNKGSIMCCGGGGGAEKESLGLKSEC